MLKKIAFTIMAAMLLFGAENTHAQGPQGKKLGFGIILGDPTGGTLKYWMNNQNSLNFSIGASYFGSPRVGADYVWHFNAFDTRFIRLYAGPGVVLGFGEGDGIIYEVKKDKFFYREDKGAGLAVRGIFGVNFNLAEAPMDIFFELGPLIGLAPEFGSAFDAAFGFRFYP
ncbi:MAG TPA: hypothetical protein VHP30_02005 [Ignavibacteriales bacterium]|nr:hypothetical protein [Ignavibacteriales bacterium]